MTYDEWSKITKMVCKRCGKTLLRWEKIWGADGGVICNKCNNEIINENWNKKTTEMNNKVNDEKITKVQLLAEYGIRVFEFATINTQAKEQVEDFLKKPNPKNMFLLFMDLILPMAESFVVYENERGEASGEFPLLKKDIKRRVEKLMGKVKDEVENEHR